MDDLLCTAIFEPYLKEKGGKKGNKLKLNSVNFVDVANFSIFLSQKLYFNSENRAASINFAYKRHLFRTLTI